VKFALPVDTTGPVGDGEADVLEEVDVELRELELELLLDEAELELEVVGACEDELEAEELVLATLDVVEREELLREDEVETEELVLGTLDVVDERKELDV
jgi:hypothetical protein